MEFSSDMSIKILIKWLYLDCAQFQKVWQFFGDETTRTATLAAL